jgi:hypothetical protein
MRIHAVATHQHRPVHVRLAIPGARLTATLRSSHDMTALGLPDRRRFPKQYPSCDKPSWA